MAKKSNPLGLVARLIGEGKKRLVVADGLGCIPGNQRMGVLSMRRASRESSPGTLGVEVEEDAGTLFRHLRKARSPMIRLGGF